jgi:hypothetical protein
MAQSINSGTQISVLNIPVNDTTDTPVTFARHPNNLLIRNRSTGAIYIRTADGASEYFTVPENMAITIDFGARTSNPIWLRAETGTPDVEILVTYE